MLFRSLHVGAVVEGSVQRFEEKVRVTVQLVEAAVERTLWADRFESDERDNIDDANAGMDAVVLTNVEHGRCAFREGARRATPVLLEPVMRVTVVTPDSSMGAVTGDLARRRGVVESLEESLGGKVIKARVPLAEMFGYATQLRSLSQGRATYTMQFSEYAEVPASLSQFVIRDRAA